MENPKWADIDRYVWASLFILFLLIHVCYIIGLYMFESPSELHLGLFRFPFRAIWSPLGLFGFIWVNRRTHIFSITLIQKCVKRSLIMKIVDSISSQDFFLCLFVCCCCCWCFCSLFVCGFFFFFHFNVGWY